MLAVQFVVNGKVVSTGALSPQAIEAVTAMLAQLLEPGAASTGVTVEPSSQPEDLWNSQEEGRWQRGWEGWGR